MQTSTPEYDEAIVADSREILFRAAVKMLDSNVKIDFAEASDEMTYSKITQIYDDKVGHPNKYITFEYNRVPLNGEYKFYPDYPMDGVEYGYVSNTLSDENCDFQTFPVLTFNLTNYGSKLQALTVLFSDDPNDGVIRDMTIEIQSFTEPSVFKDLAGNLKSRFFIRGLDVKNPSKIILTLRATSLPWRRARITDVILGDVERWDGNSITSLSLMQRGDPSNLKVPYGTCEMVIDNQDKRFDPRNKYGLFESIESKQGIDISLGIRLPNDSVEYHNIGTYYHHKDGWKTSQNELTIKWSLVDIMGLLSEEKYYTKPNLPQYNFFGSAVSEILEQLGLGFENKYKVPEGREQEAINATIFEEYLYGRSCAELLRDIAMVTNTWVHADPETGNVVFEEFSDIGKKITLDNLVEYPVMMPNENCSSIVFNIYSSVAEEKDKKEKYVVKGYGKSYDKVITVDNPFIQSPAMAEAAAKYIFAMMGGNKIEITGRGDMCSEIGDLDRIWLDKSNVTGARRIEQEFTFNDGVLKNEKSLFIATDAQPEYKHSLKILKSDYSWQVPAGVTQIKLVLIGHGIGGMSGEDGTYEKAGKAGEDGDGGLVLVEYVDVTDVQSVDLHIPEDEFETYAYVGGVRYSSNNGILYPTGYAATPQEIFARPGVYEPFSDTGDGGKGGKGGTKGIKGKKGEPDIPPGYGTAGTPGMSGLAWIFWND